MSPDVMGGKPVVRGTRIPVEIVLRKLGAGMSSEEIIKDHPRLTLEDIRAAQTFAADYLADEELVYGERSEFDIWSPVCGQRSTKCQIQSSTRIKRDQRQRLFYWTAGRPTRGMDLSELYDQTGA